MSNGSEAIFMPTMSVYDTAMMGAYINAVKGEYERGLEDYDKFVSRYGDFVSPILKDVEYWNDNTFGQLDKVYNDLVAAGIDPIRSREGLAIMRRTARNLPYAQLANIKLNAKDAEKYNEVVRLLKLQNKYDEDFADWQFRRTHGGVSMRDWDSSMGVFGADVPSPYQSMQEASKDWYAGLQNGYLGTSNGYDYFGKSPDAVRGVIAAQMPGLTSEYWLYLKDRIRNMLGPDAPEEAVNSALQATLFDSARNVYSTYDPTTGEWSNATRNENAEYKRRQEYNYDNKLDAAKAARDYHYSNLEAFDLNLDGKLSEEEKQLAKTAKTEAVKGNGKKDKDSLLNVFRESEAYAGAVLLNLPDYAKNQPKKIGNYAGTSAEFDPSKTYSAGINPVMHGTRIVTKNKDTGVTKDVFKFNAKEINKKNSIYQITESGLVIPLNRVGEDAPQDEVYTFTPDGHMRSVHTGKGYKHYISGTMRGNSLEYTSKVTGDGDTVVWIEVEEGYYGQVLKKK